MDDAWLKRGPSLDELIAERKDERKAPRNGMAVVIPTSGRKGVLSSHLSKLAAQTFKDFDTIIIYDKDTPFEKVTHNLSALHFRMKETAGIAGAYYCGELCALCEAYETIVLADDDCMPGSTRLILRIKEGLEDHAVVAPTVRLVPSGQAGLGIINWYWGIRREVFEITGLRYLPLFKGGEEFDMMHRMASEGFKPYPIEARVTHPQGPPFVLYDPKREYYYHRGLLLQIILSGAFLHSFLFISQHLMAAWAFMIIGKKRTTVIKMASIWDAVSLRLFREVAREKMLVGPPDYKEATITVLGTDAVLDFRNDPFRSGDLLSTANIISGTGGSWSDYARRIACIFAYFFDFRKFFGKRLVVDEWCSFIDLPAILMARSSFIRTNSGTYVIGKERHLLPIMSGFIFLAIALAPTLMLSFALAIWGLLNHMIRGIKSERYGIEEIEKACKPANRMHQQ